MWFVFYLDWMFFSCGGWVGGVGLKVFFIV